MIMKASLSSDSVLENEMLEKRMPTFIFKDELCLKTLNIEISNESMPLLFVFESSENENKLISNVECLMSIWINLNNEQNVK